MVSHPSWNKIQTPYHGVVVSDWYCQPVLQSPLPFFWFSTLNFLGGPTFLTLLVYTSDGTNPPPSSEVGAFSRTGQSASPFRWPQWMVQGQIHVPSWPNEDQVWTFCSNHRKTSAVFQDAKLLEYTAEYSVLHSLVTFMPHLAILEMKQTQRQTETGEKHRWPVTPFELISVCTWSFQRPEWSLFSLRPV